MNNGFFPSFLKEVAVAFNARYGVDAMLDVKSMRKTLNIPSRDRSKIMFLAKALDHLHKAGFLKLAGRNGGKKYKKVKAIDINGLHEYMAVP